MKKFFEGIRTSDIRNILAVIYVLLSLIFIYVLVFHPVPENNRDLINVIGGNVLGGLGLVLGYFFGASKRDPDDTKTK